jgi:hypothetical protein
LIIGVLPTASINPSRTFMSDAFCPEFWVFVNLRECNLG